MVSGVTNITVDSKVTEKLLPHLTGSPQAMTHRVPTLLRFLHWVLKEVRMEEVKM